MAKNKFESLRLPGIVGKVVSKDFKSFNVYERAEYSVTIYTGELLHDVWAFGYLVTGPGTRVKVLPGEQAGWFHTQRDARLYALGYLRNHDSVPEEANEAIDAEIYSLMNQSLF